MYKAHHGGILRFNSAFRCTKLPLATLASDSIRKQTNQPTKKKTQNQENRNHSLPVGHQLAQLPGSAQRQEDEIHLGQVQESLLESCSPVESISLVATSETACSNVLNPHEDKLRLTVTTLREAKSYTASSRHLKGIYSSSRVRCDVQSEIIFIISNVAEEYC